MADAGNITKHQYREFEIQIEVTEMVDGSWRAHVQVYRGSKQIDIQNVQKNFQTKVLAEQAGLAYGRHVAASWADNALPGADQDSANDPTLVFVGTSTYRFESAEAANEALQWRIDNQATPEQFAARYRKFLVAAVGLSRGLKH